MLIVKLGGSVITDKSRYLAFRDEATRKIIEILSEIDEDKIIVHGGGSFGHIKAKEYGIPGKVDAGRLEGFSIVHGDMAKLNLRVTDMLISAGIKAVSVPPAATFTDRKNYRQIRYLAENGMTPVSHGDAYITRRMVRIISGDTIVRDLAKAYRPSKVVFFSDVDGVYNRNPKTHDDAALISSLEDDIEFSDMSDDVTGGMKAKLRTMKQTASFSGGVYLINGNHPERLMEIGKKGFIGTMIKMQKKA